MARVSRELGLGPTDSDTLRMPDGGSGDLTGIVPRHSGKDWVAEIAHAAARLILAGRKSREEVLAATLCLHSVENRCGTGPMAETVSPRVRKRVLEPQKGLIALSERVKC
jgi:hypothetical protein